MFSTRSVLPVVLLPLLMAATCPDSRTEFPAPADSPSIDGLRVEIVDCPVVPGGFTASQLADRTRAIADALGIDLGERTVEITSGTIDDVSQSGVAMAEPVLEASSSNGRESFAATDRTRIVFSDAALGLVNEPVSATLIVAHELEHVAEFGRTDANGNPSELLRAHIALVEATRVFDPLHDRLLDERDAGVQSSLDLLRAHSKAGVTALEALLASQRAIVADERRALGRVDAHARALVDAGLLRQDQVDIAVPILKEELTKEIDRMDAEIGKTVDKLRKARAHDQALGAVTDPAGILDDPDPLDDFELAGCSGQVVPGSGGFVLACVEELCLEPTDPAPEDDDRDDDGGLDSDTTVSCAPDRAVFSSTPVPQAGVSIDIASQACAATTGLPESDQLVIDDFDGSFAGSGSGLTVVSMEGGRFENVDGFYLLDDLAIDEPIRIELQDADGVTFTTELTIEPSEGDAPAAIVGVNVTF